MDLAKLADKLFHSEITAAEVKQLVEYAQMTSAVFNWHPLGFVHHKLFENDGTILRLHIWPHPAGDIKSLNLLFMITFFDMTSYIVVGVQTNVLYKVCEDFDKPKGKLYSVGYVEGESWVTDTGRQVSFAEISRAEYGKNETYSMTEAIFHQSDIPDGLLVCTLVTTKIKLPRTPVVHRSNRWRKGV